jgi:hypothetical protein
MADATGVSSQQWWQGGDAQWRPGPVPSGFRQGADSRWYPPGHTGPGAPELDGVTRAAPGDLYRPGGYAAADPDATAVSSPADGAWPDDEPGGGWGGDDPGPDYTVDRPKGLRAWPTSARVTAGTLALTTLLSLGALGAQAEPAEVETAGTTTTERRPTTTDEPTTSAPTTSTTAPPTTAPPVTAPPTTAPPATTPPTTAPPPPPPTTAAPAPAPAPAPPPTEPPAPPSAYYENCDAARAAGAAPVHAGDPGYGSHLDRDGDGVGCE